MKNILLLLLAVIANVAVGYLAYQRFPSPKIKHVTTNFPMQVERSLPVKSEVEIQGQKFNLEFEVPIPVNMIRSETKELTLQPTSFQKLQFWVLTFIAVYLGGYTLFVLCLWVRDKLTQKRTSASRKDTEERLNWVVKLASTILLGFVGGSAASEKVVDSSEADTTFVSSSVRSEIP